MRDPVFRLPCILARWTVLTGCLSCTGVIDAGDREPTSQQGPPTPPFSDEGVTAGAPEGAGPWPLARLTTREYNNTIRDLLYLPDFRGIVLPNDAAGESGFLRAADVTTL